MKNVREKAIKNLGGDYVVHMESQKTEELKQLIYEANFAMSHVQEELDNNEKYQALLEMKKDMESAKREVFARQKLKIAMALEILGKEST